MGEEGLPLLQEEQEKRRTTMAGLPDGVSLGC